MSEVPIAPAPDIGSTQSQFVDKDAYLIRSQLRMRIFVDMDAYLIRIRIRMHIFVDMDAYLRGLR